jgi:hypothetical protein
MHVFVDLNLCGLDMTLILGNDYFGHVHALTFLRGAALSTAPCRLVALISALSSLPSSHYHAHQTPLEQQSLGPLQLFGSLPSALAFFMRLAWRGDLVSCLKLSNLDAVPLEHMR